MRTVELRPFRAPPAHTSAFGRKPNGYTNMPFSARSNGGRLVRRQWFDRLTTALSAVEGQS